MQCLVNSAIVSYRITISNISRKLGDRSVLSEAFIHEVT